jgi:hypothetical protein
MVDWYERFDTLLAEIDRVDEVQRYEGGEQ